MRAAFTNVPVKIGAKKGRECLRLMDGSDFIGMCEILNKHQRQALIEEARAMKRYGSYGWQGPNPVLWDASRYTLAAGVVVKLHGAFGGRLWPGYRAARKATIAALTAVHKGDPHATLLCTHWAPRGRKVPAWWRNRQWATSERKISAIVKSQTANGRSVILMGDFNMDRNPRIAGVTWLTGAGVDKIGIALAPGHRIGHHTSARFKSPTDHGTGIRADFTLEIAA